MSQLEGFAAAMLARRAGQTPFALSALETFLPEGEAPAYVRLMRLQSLGSYETGARLGLDRVEGKGCGQGEEVSMHLKSSFRGGGGGSKGVVAVGREEREEDEEEEGVDEGGEELEEKDEKEEGDEGEGMVGDDIEDVDGIEDSVKALTSWDDL